MNYKGDIYINSLMRKPQDFLLYMHQFVDAGIKTGFLSLKATNSPKYLFRRVMPLLLSLLNFFHFYRFRQKPLITTSRGDGILEAAYPHFMNYHIIPMLWDTWPQEQGWLYKDLRRLKCPLALVTARQMAIRIEQELHIKTLWIPEGIDIQGFSKGHELSSRSIDIFELGRQHARYHQVISNAVSKGYLKNWKGNLYDEDGNLLKLACNTNEELKDMLRDSKMVVCFPKIDTTSQEVSGGIETLTQRYWEVMLSRSIPIGRAPQELIDFIGYNPVVNINWDSPEEQLSAILADISKYQPLVDKNYDTACRMASWEGRMPMIRKFIEENLQT